MTNEEAKKIIFNQWQTFLDNYIDYAGVSEAYELAIKALEKEPCEDCISREEAIKPFMVDATEEWTSADIVKHLKSLLSVMPTMIYPQVPGITPIVILDEEEQGDIQYDNKTTLNNKGYGGVNDDKRRSN